MTERRARGLGVLAVALAAIPWYSALGAAFVYDDTFILRKARLDGRSLGETLSTRRPLTELTFDLNYALGGLEPFGYHLVNVLIHLVGVALAFAVVKGTLARRDELAAVAAPAAFAAALLWGVHPLQTESVTYAVQRAESLAGVFMLGALLALVREAGATPSRRRQVGAILLCLAAMASKASAASAPFILLLWDVIFGAGSWKGAFRARALLHGGCVATLSVLALVGVVGGVLGASGEGTVGFSSSVTWLEYAGSQPSVILRYLRLIPWPTPLCIDLAWPVGVSLPAVALIAAALVGTAYGVFRRRAWSFAAAAFFLALAPTSSFIPISDLYYEHRLYVALLAPLALCAAWAARFGTRPLMIGALAAACALGAATWQRNLDYHDPVRLFRDTVARSPENLRARLNLAIALEEAGAVDEALIELHRIMRAKGASDVRKPHAAWRAATILRDRGQTEDALEHFAMVIEALPGDVALRMDFAAALLRAGRVDDAVTQLDEVEKLEPGHRAARAERAFALVQRGDLDGAVTAARAMIAEFPTWGRAYELLGIALRRQGKIDEAIASYEKAVEYHPRGHEGWFNLSIALAENGDLAGGLEAAKEAFSISPSNPRYAYQIAAFHRGLKDLEGALTWVRRARDLGIVRFGIEVDDVERELLGLLGRER